MRRLKSVMGARVITFTSTILLTPVLVRLLGKSEYGRYTFLMSVFAVVSIFTRVGIADALRKYIAEENRSEQWRSHVFGFYFRLASFLGIIASVVFIIIAETQLFSSIFDSEYRSMLYLFSGLIVSYQLSYVFRNSLMGLQKEHQSELIPIIRRLGIMIIGLSLAALGYGVSGVFFGFIVANILGIIYGSYILKQFIPLRVVFETLPEDFPRKQLMSFNGLNTIFIFLGMSLTNVDIILIEIFQESSDVGVYKAALVIAEFLWFVPMIIQKLFVHSASSLWSNGDLDKLSSISARSTRYTLLITLLLSLGVSSLASEFISLYFGKGFDRAVVPILILLPGALGYAVARPIYAIEQGIGRLKLLIIVTSVAAFMNLILNIVLIPRYGIVGAAFATSIGYGSMCFLHMWAAIRMGFDPTTDLRLKQITVVVLTTVPFIFGIPLLISSPVLTLVIVPPVGLVVYMASCLWTGAIEYEELTELLDVLPIVSKLIH